jgi:hypothetical protein
MKTTHTIHPYLSQRLISRPCDLALTADVPRVIPSLSCNHPKKTSGWWFQSSENVSQLVLLFPIYIYGKIKMFQTTNQTWKSSPTKNSQIISDRM